MTTTSAYFSVALENEAQGTAIITQNRIAQMTRTVLRSVDGDWFLILVIPPGEHPSEFRTKLRAESPALAAIMDAWWYLYLSDATSTTAGEAIVGYPISQIADHDDRVEPSGNEAALIGLPR